MNLNCHWMLHSKALHFESTTVNVFLSVLPITAARVWITWLLFYMLSADEGK